MSKVLVTGASGFVGSHVVEELSARGHRVRALVRKSSSRSYLDPAVELAFGDVTDSRSLSQALAGVQGIIHCAGLTKALSVREYRLVNRLGTENLLRAGCCVVPRPARVVCLSSLAAYGPSCGGRPVSESDAPHPVSEYGRSKLEGQQVAESFMGDLSISILVPPAVYGPRDRDIYVYFKLAKMGIIPFLGCKERHLSLIYVKDLARAAVECLLREQAGGGIYFIEDGEVHTWRSFARTISTVMGKRPCSLVLPEFVARIVALLTGGLSRITRRPPLLGKDKMNEILQPSWICTGERIRKELGFESRYPLRKGLEETYQWYAKNGWL